jgi:hypothetical protein
VSRIEGDGGLVCPKVSKRVRVGKGRGAIAGRMEEEALAMERWAPRVKATRRGGWGASPYASQVSGRGLVELELRHRLTVLGLEVRRLVERELSLGRTAGRQDGWRPGGEVQVEENRLDRGRVGPEGEDLHLPAASRTQERQHLVDAGEELSPADAGGARGARRFGSGWRRRRPRYG